ncbi:MAG: ATP-binding cassette domain-containing protein [Solirubrobacteraceae bacterium]
MAGDHVLELHNVSKGFARGSEWLHVLQCVSLTVGAGEIVAVVGTRDQGKTTLLRIAAGTLLPDQGSVRVAGRELGLLKDRHLAQLLRSEVGLATRGGPSGRTRVCDYVGLQIAAGGWFGRRERRRKTIETLLMLGVADRANARWRELSNWQRVRVELAQAVVCRPQLVLVDDLFDGLMFGQKQEATRILRGFADDLGCGVLMACSDHTSALPSDRIWQLDDGALKLMADLTVVDPGLPAESERVDEATG